MNIKESEMVIKASELKIYLMGVEEDVKLTGEEAFRDLTNPKESANAIPSKHVEYFWRKCTSNFFINQ